MTNIEPSSQVSWPIWQEINDALQLYADYMDRADIDSFLSLFTPDAIWDYAPNATRQGHAEIRAFLEERFSVFAQTSHHVGPAVIRQQPDGTLTSTAYLLAIHLLKDGSTYTGYGRYEDVFSFVNGRWLINRRKVVAHVKQGTTRALNQLERIS